MLFAFPCLVAPWVFSMIYAALASPVPLSKCDCSGTTGNDTQYLCGDSRLGPVNMTFPESSSLVSIVANYNRLGGLCPSAFLQKYTNSSTGFYTYPPLQGFQLSTTRMPIDGNQTLVPGMLLDRFGSEYGMYLAPAYTPFAQRALPPSSLNDVASNYHMYEVKNNFTVLSGTIAAWFQQPGQGTQYLAMKNVLTLVAEGYLLRVDEQTMEPTESSEDDPLTGLNY
ncbi:hypothetical protein B0H11DRAFT_2155680 [Mycena galericulata]|nr:hypothetical protein B0H11DRAFT_2155680 [Mycena galericulata]